MLRDKLARGYIIICVEAVLPHNIQGAKLQTKWDNTAIKIGVFSYEIALLVEFREF